MTRPRVLYISHNHPRVRPGGAEGYALELHEGMRDAGDFDSIFLAKGGAPMSAARPHPGTAFAPAGGDPQQYFMHTERSGYDPFLGVAREKTLVVRDFRDFLLTFRPDVVHFQHTLFLGYDLIREVRNTLPEAPILYTLHEFLPICHRHGQMLRANGELCTEASPARCHECFPDIAPADFFRRRRLVDAHFELVDRFVAPSRFLLERYVDWGVPRERIVFEDYGRRLPLHPAPARGSSRRTRLAFFGQLTPYKGVDVLLEAMRILIERGTEARLTVYGANLELQSKPYRERVEQLLDETRERVAFRGRYPPQAVPRLIAEADWVVVPSIWWENSPLVIQEAFIHGRPVICSDVGGMAEKVTDRVNGIHFRVGDPVSLADAIAEAVSSDGLWDTLRGGIPAVPDLRAHVRRMSELYLTLLTARREERISA